MTRQHKSISVVIDEYGGISGIVTVEDIVEELFGEIEDEYDTIDHIEKRLDETTFDFSARLEVDYLNHKYNLSLPETMIADFLKLPNPLRSLRTPRSPRSPRSP